MAAPFAFIHLPTSASRSTLAGRGDFAVVDGQGRAAAFYQPRAVVLDAQGNLYVGEHNRIRKVTPGGLVTTYAGGGKGTYADGAAKTAAMGAVTGLVLAPDGTLYFSDYGNDRLRKVTPDGQVVSVAGTGVSGSADGPGSAASFGQLQGLALGPDGAVYVISLNGVTSELVQDNDGTGWYHVKDDPGWRVQHLTGGHGADDEYWVVSTQEGIRYYFGWGRSARQTGLPRWAQLFSSTRMIPASSRTRMNWSSPMKRSA